MCSLTLAKSPLNCGLFVYLLFCYTAYTSYLPRSGVAMQSSYKYIVSSNLAQLRIYLAGDTFAKTKAAVASVIPGVTVSFSGTEPCIPVEINCVDIASLLAS